MAVHFLIYVTLRNWKCKFNFFAKSFHKNVLERRPVKLPINVLKDPTEKHLEIGEELELNCTADGTPTPSYTWTLNGKPVNATGPLFHIPNLNVKTDKNNASLVNTDALFYVSGNYEWQDIFCISS